MDDLVVYGSSGNARQVKPRRKKAKESKKSCESHYGLHHHDIGLYNVGFRLFIACNLLDRKFVGLV